MSTRTGETIDASAAWFIDSAGRRTLTQTEDGIFVETHSAGEYADIPSEEVTAVLQNIATRPWRQAIRELYESRNPWLYRIVTDPSRAMPLEILNISREMTCLDVGSGWGQLSIPLAQWGCNVVALDLTLDRLRIVRAIAKQEGAPITFAKGNILTFPLASQAFDLILFNGTLEWVGTGRGADRTIRQCQVDALARAAAAAKPTGKIFIGIENNIGLKYLMGARDDHTGQSNFSFRSEREADDFIRSLGGERATAKTWGLKQLEEIAAEAGLKLKSVFGCFPDYKVPRHLVPIDEVNDFLRKSEIDWTEHHGDRGEPLADQEAIRAAYRQLAGNAIAQWLCPSYVLVLVKP